MTVNDPIPAPLTGDPSVIGAKSGVMLATADALRTAISELRNLSNENVTISDAVDEVRVKADGVRGDIEKVEQRYRGAAVAMGAYKVSLENAQTRANNARTRISDNNSDAAYWRRREDEIEYAVRSGESSEELLAELLAVQRKVNTYANEFTSAMSEYYGAEDDKENAVATAIQALVNAAEAAKLDDGFWDKVGAVLEAAYEWAQKHLAPLIEQLRAILEIIKGIVDILALIVGVLSIFLPFLAPLAAALTLVSVGLSAAILLCSLALFALGKESLGRVLSDALNVVVGVVTAKMGGVNVFRPGSSLTGFSQAFSPSAWQQGMSMVRFEFALLSAVTSRGEAAATFGMEVIKANAGSVAVTLAGDVAAGYAENGLDVNFDLFPESGPGGMWGPFEGGWELTSDEHVEVWAEPVANALSGGVASPVMDVVNGVNTLTVGAS